MCFEDAYVFCADRSTAADLPSPTDFVKLAGVFSSIYKCLLLPCLSRPPVFVDEFCTDLQVCFLEFAADVRVPV